MKKFTFRLETLLRHRRRLLEERQKEVAACVQQLAAAEGELRRLDTELADATGELTRNHLRGPVDLSYLAAHRRYANSMHIRISRQMDTVREVREQLDRRRAVLKKAWQDVRVLERLRETRFEDYRQQARRAQEVVSNEVGLNLFRLAAEQGAAREEIVTMDEDRGRQTDLTLTPALSLEGREGKTVELAGQEAMV